MKKGQASLELLVTLGIVLAFSIPVLFLLFSVTSYGYQNTANAQAEASARILAESMNIVYSQGNGAENVVLLNLPSTALQTYAQDNEVVIVMRTQKGTNESIAWPTIAPVSNTQTPSVTLTKTGLFSVEILNNHGSIELIDPNGAG